MVSELREKIEAAFSLPCYPEQPPDYPPGYPYAATYFDGMADNEDNTGFDGKPVFLLVVYDNPDRHEGTPAKQATGAVDCIISEIQATTEKLNRYFRFSNLRVGAFMDGSSIIRACTITATEK